LIDLPKNCQVSELECKRLEISTLTLTYYQTKFRGILHRSNAYAIHF